MPSLTLIATPIGNLGDLSPRAAKALADADIWIVEDTRVSAKLQVHLGIKRPMRIANEHASIAQLERLLAEIREREGVALITDAGTPSVSDPGAILADMCYGAGIEVRAVPGPSSVTAALMLSGFFAQRFGFLGFLARKPGPMRRELEPFADSPMTLVVFESPFRVRALLEAAYDALGERRYAICRELTKAHEQVWRSTLPRAPTDGELPAKGEVTIVFEGRRRKKNSD